MAAYYTIITFLIVIFRGIAPYEEVGVSVGRALAAYWIGGIAGGAVWGLLLPLVNTRPGAVVLGIVVAVPPSLAIELAGSAGASIDWETVAFMSVAFGSVCGFVLASMGGPSWREIGDLEDRVDRYLDGETDTLDSSMPNDRSASIEDSRRE